MDMKQHTRSFAGIAAALSVIFAMVLGLVGCGQPDPTSTEELLAAYALNGNISNFHADLDISIKMGLLGQEISMPIRGSYDIADDRLHGTYEADLSAIGQQSLSVEQYVEKENGDYVQYVGVPVNGQTVWGRITPETNASSESSPSSIASEELLKSAEFQRLEGSDPDACYQLSIPSEKLFEALSSLGSASSLDDGSNGSMVAEALKGGTANFVFDKDCNLREINMQITYGSGEGSESTEGQDDITSTLSNTFSLSIDLDLSMKISKQGEISADELAVPDEVKGSATEVSKPSDLVQA